MSMAEDHNISDDHHHQDPSKFHDQPSKGFEKEDSTKPIAHELPNDRQEDLCRTPTSSDHKILTSQSCPATPRKLAQGNVFLHKRKLARLDFFETTRREEVDSFFRSCFEESPSSRAKKRCTSI
ncbi:hypothetical protein C1H46_010379 [Malus baccata]|uniref:Cyclin-dependent protein kinase inhibitor SMR2 n=1 Tax=Malus baccata TaxID=106549 RepID=A0A540MYY1_MALBA|nr:hypothetical protein C1H46_010379 [Malus baccata]